MGQKMKLDLVIEGGLVTDVEGERVTSIGIQDGKICAFGDLSSDDAVRTIAATGLRVIPGVIDTQVHFREPGLTHKEDIESGTRSAICGGVTTIFEMPNTKPPTTTQEALELKLSIANKTAWCDFAFFVGASKENIGELAQLEMLPGTPGIKLFAGSSTGSLLVEDEDSIKAVMQAGVRPMPVHSEDEMHLRANYAKVEPGTHVREHPHIRDVEAAVISTKRIIHLCELTGRPMHILHVSTIDELTLIQDAKDRGLPITCEVTPQHLTLNEVDYETKGTQVQMNPPIRDEKTRLALWQAVKDGLFDVIGSDHAPHTVDEKSKPFPDSPSGIPGVQTLLPLMMNWVSVGQFSWQKLVEMTSTHPAELYGIQDKGAIRMGYDADLVLIDPEAEWEIQESWLESKCGWSPFVGKKIKGQIESVILRGSEIVKNGELVGSQTGQACRFVWK